MFPIIPRIGTMCACRHSCSHFLVMEGRSHTPIANGTCKSGRPHASPSLLRYLSSSFVYFDYASISPSSVRPSAKPFSVSV